MECHFYPKKIGLTKNSDKKNTCNTAKKRVCYLG